MSPPGAIGCVRRENDRVLKGLLTYKRRRAGEVSYEMRGVLRDCDWLWDRLRANCFLRETDDTNENYLSDTEINHR